MKKNTSLMHNIGLFFGHIAKAVRTNPSIEKKVVSKTVEQTKQGNITLRRTTIEEIEINAKPDKDESAAPNNDS